MNPILLSGYLFILTVILFCKAVRKSVLYNKPAGGLLAFLVAIGVLYVANIANFLLAPFGAVSRQYVFFTIDVGRLGMGKDYITVSCSDDLRITAGGVGTVEYRGSPTIDMTRGGLVTIRQLG